MRAGVWLPWVDEVGVLSLILLVVSVHSDDKKQMTFS